MMEHPTPLPGLTIIDEPTPSPVGPHCLFDANPFEQGEAQMQVWREPKPRTLRGMRVQMAPKAQAHLVRPIAGTVWVMVLDLRRSSPTFSHWYGVELRGDEPKSLWIPEACAHGFLTLGENNLLLSLASVKDEPILQRGIRWDDPQFGMAWPYAPEVISELDSALPDTPLDSYSV
ncbi:dTDP-4-dehydrorhamnose 3,5-epimerase family protein [Magnetococcus sp. PR-3]|uniref:dTDP-4-dehydrorhamnose 3,5-epimerase family protein n=1 Tax=Magnetococcus sp. PR-3 TaxID=3120355 RepID=UPI002FCDFF1A